MIVMIAAMVVAHPVGWVAFKNTCIEGCFVGKLKAASTFWILKRTAISIAKPNTRLIM